MARTDCWVAMCVLAAASAGLGQPRKPSFRRPGYSLADEPQRVKPLTVGDPRPAPHRAVVFGRPIRWWWSHWSGKLNTACAGMEDHPDFLRFSVAEPDKCKVWVKYFDVPIDPQRYPIMVLTYRAQFIDPVSSRYVLYLDDGCGPDYGGLIPVRQNDLLADGEMWTVTCDLRPMEPFGDLIGLAVGVHCDWEGPAQFDLFGLRFEAAADAPNPPLPDGKPLHVRVTDPRGRALAGATVTVDAERSNWARSATTNAMGVARVVPCQTQSGRHMVRVTMPGMMPADVRDLPPAPGPIEAALEPAAAYGGIALGEDGHPLPRAAVRVRLNHAHPTGLWTRVAASVLTDEAGRWRTPPLPAAACTAQIDLAHPDYTVGRRAIRLHCPPVEKLHAGDAVLLAKPVPRRVGGRVVDEQNAPVANAQVLALSTQSSVTTGPDGAFRVAVFQDGGCLVVQKDGYAPTLVRVPQAQPGEDAPIVARLARGRTLRGQIVDEAGAPVSHASVRVRSWRGVKLSGPVVRDGRRRAVRVGVRAGGAGRGGGPRGWVRTRDEGAGSPGRAASDHAGPPAAGQGGRPVPPRASPAGLRSVPDLPSAGPPAGRGRVRQGLTPAPAARGVGSTVAPLPRGTRTRAAPGQAPRTRSRAHARCRT